jgi:hypothetical protein
VGRIDSNVHDLDDFQIPAKVRPPFQEGLKFRSSRSAKEESIWRISRGGGGRCLMLRLIK